MRDHRDNFAVPVEVEWLRLRGAMGSRDAPTIGVFKNDAI